jgi:AcrR family transcriptional regulator
VNFPFLVKTSDLVKLHVHGANERTVELLAPFVQGCQMSDSLQSPGPREVATASQARLLDIGFEMALKGGLGALSARALAEKLKASPSTMNYHFGNRDGFLGALQKRALAQSEAWRLAHVGAPRDVAPWTTTPDVLLALLLARLSQTRRLQLLLLEFAAEAEVCPLLVPDARTEADADAGFWRDVAMRVGETKESAAVWSDMAAGLILNFCSEDDPSVLAAWMGGALRRLADRMAGRTPPLFARPTGPTAAQRLDAQVPRGATAERIVRAALQIIGQKGAARMSQRDVAAAAGVSLAAVTYFYRSRADLIAAAFSSLHSGVRSEVLDRAAGAQSPTSWSAQVFDDAGNFDWRVSAMRELIILSGRDRGLIRMVQDIRSGHGATSISLLQRQGVVDADQLDAFVLSTVLRGASERGRFAQAHARRAAFESRAAQIMATVFKAGPTATAGCDA